MVMRKLWYAYSGTYNDKSEHKTVNWIPRHKNSLKIPKWLISRFRSVHMPKGQQNLTKVKPNCCSRHIIEGKWPIPEPLKYIQGLTPPGHIRPQVWA